MNPSFESPSLADGGYTSGSIDGWVASGGYNRGVLNPNTDHLVPPTDGVQVAYIDPDGNGVASVTQTLAATLAAGETYTLQVDFAYRKNCCGTPAFTVALLAGGTPIASFTGGAADGFSNAAFATATVSYAALASDPLLGAALGIRISTAGAYTTQIDFDNVRLNADPVPLPPAAWLLPPALGFAARFARRRRQG